MFSFTSLAFLFALASHGANAAPASVPIRRAVTPVPASVLAGLAPYTQFARAAYCPTSKLQGWGCGGKLGLSFWTMLFDRLSL